MLKHTLGWGYLYLWGDEKVVQTSLNYPQQRKVAKYCYEMLNTEGDRIKKSYLAIDYSSLDRRIESNLKEVTFDDLCFLASTLLLFSIDSYLFRS